MNMNNLGCKATSHELEIENPCLHSSGHMFNSSVIQLGHDACLDSVISQTSLIIDEDDSVQTDSISQTSLELYQNDITEKEFPREETFEQDVNSHSSGHLSVTGNESSKENEEGILSEFQIDSSFGNSATLDLLSSDVSTKIGCTKQEICQHIPFESTQQEDGSHLNGCFSGYMSVNASCKDRTGSKRLYLYSEKQSDGKDRRNSKVNENEGDLCSRKTTKCQPDRVKNWLISNNFESKNTDIDDYKDSGKNECKCFENSITHSNKGCKCAKISKDKAFTDVSDLTRSSSNTKAKGLNKDNDSGQLDYLPDAHPLHDHSKERSETHARTTGNFQTNFSITPKNGHLAESMLHFQCDSLETNIIASSSRKSNSLQNISNNKSKNKNKNFPVGNKSSSSYIHQILFTETCSSWSRHKAKHGRGLNEK